MGLNQMVIKEGLGDFALLVLFMLSKYDYELKVCLRKKLWQQMYHSNIAYSGRSGWIQNRGCAKGAGVVWNTECLEINELQFSIITYIELL